MTVEEAVRAQLLATSAVTDLVGTRIYMLVLPQKPTLPAIRVQLIDNPEDYHLRGPVDLTPARVQVDVYAHAATSGNDPYASASAIAEQVNAALIAAPWSTGSPGRQIAGAFRKSRRTMYEGDEFRIVRVFQDYMVHSALAAA